MVSLALISAYSERKNSFTTENKLSFKFNELKIPPATYRGLASNTDFIKRLLAFKHRLSGETKPLKADRKI